MSITRIYQTGAEWGTAAMEFSSVVGGNFTASTADKKTGSYAFRTEGYDYAKIDLSTQYNVDYTVPANLYQVRVGFWCKNPGATAGTSPRLVSVVGAGGTEGAIIRWDVDNTELECYSTQAGSVLDSAVNATFAGGSWVHIGLDVKIDNPNGWIYLYVNGTEVLNYDGDTTGGGFGITDIDGVLFGGVQSTGNNWNQYLYFDDIYVDDTSGESSANVVPRYQFMLAAPDGEGPFSEWYGNDGDVIDNYLLIDDVPSDGGATNVYITTAFPGNRETVTLADVDTTGFDIVAVYPHAIVKRGIDAADLEMKLYVRDDASGDFGSSLNMPVGTAYQLAFDERLVTLAAGAWTQTDVNNLIVGVVSD